MKVPHATALAGAASRLWDAGIEDSHLEAEVLLAHVAGVSRSKLLARLTELIGEADIAAFDALVDRRLRREPLAYITGHREFYGIDIVCDRRALIPRPETEMLVDLALEELSHRSSELRIIDVGTGTGAIAIAIAATNASAKVVGVDSSTEALSLAQENVVKSGVGSRVLFEKCDLLEGAAMFDVILANLPYISHADCGALPSEIRDWEPMSALVAGEHGTEVIERLVKVAPSHLASGGVLVLEVGLGQASDTIAFGRTSFPAADIHARKDLAGINRVVVVRMP